MFANAAIFKNLLQNKNLYVHHFQQLIRYDPFLQNVIFADKSFRREIVFVSYT